MKTSTKNQMLRWAFLFSAIGLAACERSSVDHQDVRLRLPDGLSSSFAIQSSEKLCFGVSASSPQTAVSAPSSCSPSLGLYSGFTPEGGDIVLNDVPAGSDYQFNLYALVVSAASTCPSWNAAFNTSPGQPFSRVFNVGSKGGVSLNGSETLVEVPISTSALTTPVSATQNLGVCAPTTGPSLHAVLTSDGEVRSPTFVELLSDVSLKGLVDAFFGYFEGSDHSGVHTPASVMTVSYNGADPVSFNVAPEVWSLTVKPDSPLNSPQMYGLVGDGDIVVLNSVGQAVAPSTCPFRACRVPAWIQSISAGYGDKLYALDHAGQLYEVTGADQVEFLGVTFDPTVTQVSYY